MSSEVGQDEYNVPASEIDALIEQRIFGGCAHSSFDLREYQQDNWLRARIVCRACSAEIDHPGGSVWLGDEYGHFDNPSPWTGWTNTELLDLLRKKTITPYCHDIITTRRALRELETKGWSWTYASRDGLWRYTLSKNGRDVTGAPAREEYAAIANALGELVMSSSPI